MNKNGDRIEIVGLAIAAGITFGVGYGAYRFLKLVFNFFGNSNEEPSSIPESNPEGIPESIPAIYVVDSPEKCQWAMEMIKWFAHNIILQIFFQYFIGFLEYFLNE